MARLFLTMFLLLSLVFSNGCNNIGNNSTPSQNPDTTTPAGPLVSAQMVFDQAALGPDKTDLNKLKSLYDQAIKDTTQANSLSEIKDPNKEYFIHKLVSLPAQNTTKTILSHFTSRLSNAPNAINPIDSSKQPLAILTDPARSVNGDQPLELQEMIKILADQGDDKTIAAADTNGLKAVLDAVLAKGNKALMTKVFDGADVTKPAIKTATFNWVASKKADLIAGSADTVEGAFLATTKAKTSATAQDLVDEAARGPIGPGGTDLAKLAIFYNLAIRGDATGTKAAALAGQPASTPTADRFAHYLARLTPDADILAIWTDYLTQIFSHPAGINGAAAGVASVDDQVLLAGVVPADTPLKLVLSQVADTADRNRIIQLMISRNRAVLPASVAAPEVVTFLTALRKEENQADFLTDFGAVLGAEKDATLNWAVLNQALTIAKQAGTPSIKTALAGVFTHQMVVDEAAKGPGVGNTDITKLRLLYESAVTTDAHAVALALQPVTGLVVPDRFANYLAKLAPDADVLAIWTDYLGKIATHAGGGAPAIAAVTAQVNYLDAGGIKALSSVLGQADTAHRNQIVQLMISRDRAGLAALVAAPEVTNFLAALRQEENQADFLTDFGAVLGVQKDATIDWAVLNQGQTIAKQAGNPSIKAALAGVFTNQMVVDEAAKGPGVGGTDIPTLKLLYESAVTIDAHAAALASLAATVATADRFANYLAKLDPDADVLAIWTDYLGKIATHAGGGAPAIAAVTAQVNYLDAGGIKALSSVLGQADTAHRNQIVQLMISRDRAGLAALVAAPEVTNFLAALRQEENQADFLTDFGAVLGVQKDATIDWAVLNQGQTIAKQAGNPSIKAALAGVFTNQMVVDEAAKGPGVGNTDITKLRLLYESAVTIDAHAAALALQAGTGPVVADRFANYLAKLAPDADILAIWDDYLTRIGINAGGGVLGAAAVLAQVSFLGAGLTPLNLTLTPANSPFGNKIVKRMIDGNVALAVAAVDANKIDKFLTALREEDSQANFITAFGAIIADPAKKADAIAWAETNKTNNILADATSIKDALITAALITPQMVVNGAAAVANPASLAAFKFLYEVAIISDATGAKAKALRLLVSPPGGSKFIKLLAKIAPDADTPLIFVDYLSKLTNKQVKSEVKEVDSVDLANLLDAIQTKGTLPLMKTALAQNDVGKLDAAIAWAMAHRTNDISGSGIANEVLLAMRAHNSMIKRALVVAEVAKPDAINPAAPTALERNWKKVLFYTQVLAHNENSALALAQANTGGILLHKLILAKSQTAESVQALKYYLSFLTNPNWTNILNDAVGGSNAVAIINNPAHPDAANLLPAVGLHPIKDALLIFENGGVAQAAAPARDPIVDQAP